MSVTDLDNLVVATVELCDGCGGLVDWDDTMLPAEDRFAEIGLATCAEDDCGPDAPATAFGVTGPEPVETIRWLQQARRANWLRVQEMPYDSVVLPHGGVVWL